MNFTFTFISTAGKKLHIEEIFVVKFGGTVQIGRPRSRKDDIIKIDLNEMGCGVMDQI